MASPVGKEQQGNAASGTNAAAPDASASRDPDVRSAGEPAKPEGGGAAGDSGMQALVPAQGPGSAIGSFDFDLDEDFELPSVLRPDTSARPRGSGPRLRLSQLSPVRQRPGAYVPPTLTTVPPPMPEAERMADAPPPSPPSTTPPLRLASVSVLPSSQAAEPADWSRQHAATSAPTSALPNEQPSTPRPPEAAPAAALESTAAPVAPSAPIPPAAPPETFAAAQSRPSPGMMPFLDTRMRRMAEAAYKPPQIEPAPAATPFYDPVVSPASSTTMQHVSPMTEAPPSPPPVQVAQSQPVHPMPAHDRLPHHGLEPQAMWPDAAHPAGMPPSPPRPAYGALESDPFNALPSFEMGAAGKFAAPLPPPLPATVPTPPHVLDPSLLQAPFSADELTSDILGGVDNAAADLLRPLLRDWLSDNMPRIVEKALRIEIAKAVAMPDEKPKE